MRKSVNADLGTYGFQLLSHRLWPGKNDLSGYMGGGNRNPGGTANLCNLMIVDRFRMDEFHCAAKAFKAVDRARKRGCVLELIPDCVELCSNLREFHNVR